MLRKTIALLISLSFFSLHAKEATHDVLKSAFDELHYSLTVEWDQKDSEFYQEQMKAFSKKLGELQKQGLDNKELIKFVTQQIPDEKMANDLEKTLNMIDLNLMDPAEARQYALNAMVDSYSSGANYSGSTGIMIGSILLITIAIVAVAVSGGNVYVSSCNYYTVCDDYYDWWGRYLYTDCYSVCW